MKRVKGNKVFLALIIMLAVLGTVSVSSPCTVQAMSKSAQHKLYKKTMKNYARKVKASYKRNSVGLSSRTPKVLYLFGDIDKNGTDELIMRYGYGVDRNTAVSSGYGESTTIYTIKKGKVITVLDHTNVNPLCHDNFVRIFKNRSRIDMGLSHGYDDHLFCKYSNGKLYTRKNTIWMTATDNSARYNDKKISFSTYRKKYNYLTNNRKGYIMKYYK